MFGMRRRPRQLNPAVQKAIAERDKQMKKAEKAIKNVDRVQEQLLREYEEANHIRREGG